jgi:signal transduction histidine kinase
VLPLLVSLLALAALWGYAAAGMAGDALQHRGDANRVSSAGDPVRELVARLQDERLATAVWQNDPGDVSRAELERTWDDTDEAARRFTAERSAVESAGGAAAGRTAELTETLDGLAELRTAVDEDTIGGIEAFRGYTDAAAEGTALFAVAVQGGSDSTGRGATAVTALVRTAEMLSRGEALLHLADADGTAPAVEEEFARSLAVQREIRAALDGRDLPSAAAADYAQLTAGEAWQTLTAAEAPAGSGTTALPADRAGWAEAAQDAGAQLRGLTADALDSVASDGTAEADRTLLAVALGTVLALAALVGSALLARRVWRSLSGRMAELEHTTREFTEQRLPQLTQQLLRAKPEMPVDLAEQPTHSTDELGRVAAATDEQWRRMVETLVSQAQGRAGTETMLLGLARRTQSLINRMIPKLDKLEREHQDSRLLKDIFAVDHLATRVRRHTENLLILGGSLPARRWGKPVPIYEVIRSAISETEDYSRVEAMPAPAVSLTGRAVADVSHLLAELIENGTSFSPPETKVSVSAEIVAKGRVALEVVDRGLGMSPAEYDRLNLLLADPPKLDMMNMGNTPRLGLLVVARLAKRHGLEVVLRRSPYGGTLAVVLLQSTLLEQAKPLLPDIMADGARAEEAAKAEHNAPAHAAPAYAGATAHHGEAESSWIGGDDSGYPSYSGAGLVPPGAENAAPEQTAAPPPLMAQRQPPPSVPEGLSPMVSGGAGLLPPSEPGAAGHEYPGGMGAPVAPPVPDTAAVSMAATGSPDTTDTGHTREAPMTPHTGGHREDRDGRENREGRDSHGAGGGMASGDSTVGAPPLDVTRSSGSELHLPTRVRGENLHGGLRTEPPPLGRDGKGLTDSAPSPERAARTIGAIQSGNRRARAAAAQSSPGGHDQAATPGHASGSEEPARKDQR